MIEEKIGAIPVLKFEHLSKVDGVEHYITTREGGYSKGPFASFNLSSKDEYVEENRLLLARELGLMRNQLVFPHQVHECAIQTIANDQWPLDLNDTDGLITTDQKLALHILAADCVPVLLYDPKKKVVACCHAGWRGTVKNIAAKTVLKMQHFFKSNPEDILAGIGPSIGPDSFETGIEVVNAFDNLLGSKAYSFVSQKNNRYYIDLWGVNQYLLYVGGLLNENIEIAGIDTMKDARFYSHRANAGVTGRFAAGIMLKD